MKTWRGSFTNYNNVIFKIYCDSITSISLIIAEEGVVRDLLCELLLAKGAEVTTAFPALTDEKQLNQAPPDLAIADLATPGINPLSFIRKIRTAIPAVPLVLVNADCGKETLQAMENAGADRIIGRPLAVDRIVHNVSEILAMRKAAG